MIDRNTVDRILAAADIVEVISDFISLKKKGTNFTACCPFHNEKTPSFMVSPAKGLFKCFGCGKGGGSVNFVMEHEKLSYPEALKWIARKYGIEVQEKQLTEEQIEKNNDRESMLVVNSWAQGYFSSQLTDTQEGKGVGLSYFRERGFTAQTIKEFALGYCPQMQGSDAMSQQAVKEGFQEKFLTATGLTILKENSAKNRYYDRFSGRVIFPIHSLTGRVIGFGGRTMSTDKKTAKYLNSPQSEIYDKSQTLYGIFQAKKSITQKDKCILVEGYTDVMQMHQSGVENVVASSGTSLTELQVKLIKRFTKNVTVIYDGDAAGIKASLRGIDMLLKEGLNVRVVPLPEGEDPDSFARSHSSTQLEEYIKENEEDFLKFKTRILLDDSKDDPASRAALINDVVRSISVIPNDITREVYIKECSADMNVSYDVLSRAVVTAILSVPNPYALGRNVQQPYNASSGYSSGSGVGGDAEHPDDLFAEPEDTPYKTPVQGQANLSMEALELELVGYLLKYGDETFEYELSDDNVVQMAVGQTIVDELKNDNIEFSEPLYSSILSEYSYALKTNGRCPTIEDILSSGDSRVASKVADIVTKDEIHKVSGLWNRFEMQPKTEKELLWKSVPKAILLYKSKVIEQQIRNLQLQMAENIDDIDEDAIERIQSLNTIKGGILDRYKRLI
ncbi:MAG: DNA primase [Rikenellaceae bacterium]